MPHFRSAVTPGLGSAFRDRFAHLYGGARSVNLRPESGTRTPVRILGTGKLLMKVPETMRFYLEGELPKGVMAKDVILNVIGDIGFDGATYRAMQWEGPGASALNIDDRMTIANMAIEAGGQKWNFPG